jgi:Histidine kinase
MHIAFLRVRVLLFLLLFCSIATPVFAQQTTSEKKFSKASRKIESGYEKGNPDTLASGYFDLYEKGDLLKSESYYQKSKTLYEKSNDAEGIARSSRALAIVQEDLHKNKEAISNYSTAQLNSNKTGDVRSNTLNANDIGRLSRPDSLQVQQRFLLDNINFGISNKDTNEIVNGFSRMGDISLKNKQKYFAVNAFESAYKFSANNPVQALKYNQRITDLYLQDKNFPKAIEAKQEILKQAYVQGSTQLKAQEITSLAEIYVQQKDDNTAIRLLNESYQLSVKNGHTLEAKKCIEKLDSIYQAAGKKEISLRLYKNFLTQLPGIISIDSSLIDNKVVSETEAKIKQLESEKALKDDLIRRKNIFNYWLIGSVIVLILSIGLVLFMLKKLRTNNKKIALQSLRREMNPHFIFNSLNSINQFISNNNELEANRYLTKFSTLMRRVMENSKEDFVLFSKEIELLQNYLELERSRFPDKFNFTIHIDDALYAGEGLSVPGMLIQPHLENAIWHGLRYMDAKGQLQLRFTKAGTEMKITIEDNGIGIAESKKAKTVNQQKHAGRGITNTRERIKILNELYHHHITCLVEDKAAPESGVRVTLTVPLLENQGS